ncbi:Uncharacterised protein [Mycobacteroides abscessus subsp. abscessus]
MTDDSALNERIAEVVSTHRRSWSLDAGGATCTAPACDWRYLGTISVTERAHAEHLSAEIVAALYPKHDNIEAVSTYESYEVYVDSGRADELFRAFCNSLGSAIEKSWKDTEDV